VPAKIVHKADRVSISGAVSALCFKKPRAINLKLASWTNRDEAVTCKACKKVLGGIAVIKAATSERVIGKQPARVPDAVPCRSSDGTATSRDPEGAQKRVHQCKSCPWKVTTDPVRDIPNYVPELARSLDGTIATCPMQSLAPVLGGAPMRIMACHYSKPGEEIPCAGWLENQLGPGNNIGVRLLMVQGKLPVPVTEGEQHERYEDTLPCDMEED
jgi:hypothetical protein